MKVRRIISLLLVLATVLAMGFASAFAADDADKLNVTKTITWDTTTDKNKAKVTITSNVPHVEDTKVLYVGTLCGAHSLEKQTVIDSIEAIAQNANVKYYLMNEDTGTDRTTPAIAAQGTVSYKGKMTDTQKSFSFSTSGNHSAMAGFISVLTSELGTDDTVFKYDYVVLEFDGTRLAKYAASPDATSNAIAKVMKAYYDNEKVIWVTDGFDGDTSAKVYGALPYVPNNEYYDSSDTKSGHITGARLRTLCSILAPDYYFAHTNASDTTYYGDGSNKFALGVSSADFYKADARKNSPYCLTPGYKTTTGIYSGHYAEDSRQMYYNTASDLSDFLYMAIKGVTLKFNDKIKVSDSDTVKVTDVKVSATADNNTDVTKITSWTQLCSLDVSAVKESELKTDDKGVKYAEKTETNGIIAVNTGNTGDKASQNNLLGVEAVDMKNSISYVKVEVELYDSEGFKSCIEPKLDAEGKQVYEEGKPVYVMNPNNGPAKVEAFRLGESTGSATAKGENTAQAPVVKVYEVLSTVENGTQDYDTKTQKGTKTDTATGIKVSTFEGDNPVLTYKPNTGYIIKSIAIDGTEITLDKDGKYESKVSGKEVEVTTDSSGNVTVKFPNLAADRTVDVKYDTANKKLTFTKTWSDSWTGHDAITINIYVSGSTDVVETVTLDKDNTSKDVYVKAKDASGNPISYVYKEVDKDGNPVEKGSANGNYRFDYTETGSPDVAVAVTNTYIVQPKDMELGKTATKSGMAKAGEEFDYTLTVKNTRTHANETATNVVIEDTIPTGLTIQKTDPTDGVVVSANKVTWTVASLDYGKTATLKISVKVPDDVSAVRYSNQSKLVKLNDKDVPDTPENPAPKSPETNTDVPGFTVAKDVTLKGETASIKDTVQNAGSEITYSIKITNNHQSKDATTEFVDKVPAGLEVDEKSISNSGTYDKTAGTITWTGIEVKAGKDVTVSFNAKVPATITEVTEYKNTAFVTKVGEDPYEGPGSEEKDPPEVPFKAAPVYKMRLEKVWSDGWDAHKNDTVTVTVKANDVALEDKLTLDYEHQYVETGYPAVDDKGVAIAYTVEEDAIAGYKASYETTPAEKESDNNVHTITNTYIVQPKDMELGKTATKSGMAKAGEEFDYTLTVKNTRTHANETATNVVIEDTIPTGLTIQKTDPTDGVAVSGNKVTWTVASLDYGKSATLKISVKVPDDVSAVRYSNQSKLVKLNDKDVPDTPENPAPKSPETKTDVPGFTVAKDVTLKGETASIKDTVQNAGSEITYSIKITNNHQSKDATTEFVDIVPKGLEVDEKSISNGGTYVESTREITWTGVEVKANSDTTLSFNAKVPATITEETEYKNTAFVTKVGEDPYEGPGSEEENPGEVPFKAAPLYKMRVEKVWSDGWDEHKKDTVTVTVKANDVALKDKLTLDYDHQYVDEGYPALDAEGKAIVYTIEEDAVAGYKASYVTTPAEEASDNNVHTVTNTYIVKPEDMELGKKATETGTAKAGEEFDYTLTVKNTRTHANETATNVVIEDTIPDGLTIKKVDPTTGVAVSGNKVTWTVASLDYGETATLKITVKVPDDAVAVQYSNQSKLVKLNDEDVPDTPEKPAPKSPDVKTDVRSFEINKVWLDKEGKPITDTSEMPEVNIVLLRNGARFGAYGCTLSNDNDWSYTFENLWAADADGVAYVYTVEEVPLDKYSWEADYDDDTKSEDFGYTQATVINTTKKVVVDYVFKGKAEDIPDGVVVPDSETVDYGTEYTAKSTEGYEQYKEQYYYFSGWFTDDGCTQPYVEKTVLDKETAPNGTFTLYGKWERKQVDVEVVKPAVGPDIKYPDPWKKSEGETPGAKDPVDPNNDYTFKGYYTDPSFDESTKLDPNDPLTKEKYPNGLKLYPKWVKNCVVTYTFEGDTPLGAVEPDDDKVEPGTEYNSSTEYGKAEGYKFSGWYTDEKLTNKYIEGTVLEEDMDLYGKWSAINDYTVSKDVKFNKESIKDGSIYSGNTVTYTIDVTNNNTAVVMTAELVDKIPEGLTVVPSSISYPESCVVTATTLTWTLELAPGETKQLSYNATIPANLAAATQFANKAYVSKSNGEPYKPDTENPKPGTPENPAIVKFTGVPVKIITFTKGWSDTWDNHSSVVINLYANGVLKESIFLDNGEHKSETRYVNAYDAAGNPINYTYREVYSDTDVGKGEMNGKYLFDYTETADAEKATVDVAVTNTYQIGPEDLEFNKTADGQAVAGSTFTYTLTVRNARAYETAANVVVVDTIPEGLEVTGWTEGATVAFEGQVCTWTIAEIAPEETATLQITVKVPEGTAAAEYTNQAEITNIGETPVPPGTKPSPEAKTTVRSFTVTKLWDERVKKEDRPSVTVTLMQNDKKYGDSVILSGDKLSHTWDKLPLRDEKSVPYAYTVVEDKIEGFTAEVNYTGEPSVYGNAAAEITNTLKTITVSYQYLGEDKPSGKPLPETAYVEYGSKYDSAQKPEADYYEFSGWYTDVECKNLYVDGTVLNDTTVPTGSMVLYGKWTRKTATVTPFYIDKPEGIKVPDPVTLKQGDKYTPPEAPTVTGYEFGGWYSDPECTKEYKGGIVTGDMAVYGKWHKLVNVTYSYTGSIPSGATVPTSASMRKGTAYTAAATPSVSGYTFSGWYTDSGCTQLYANGTAINADTVLYGKWTKNSSGGTTTSDTVKTGDNSNAGTYVIIALATSACIGGTIAVSNYRKKKKEQ